VRDGSDPPPATIDEPSAAGRRARQALLVAAAVYVGYALCGLLPIPGDLRYVLLVAAFYFAPSWALRGEPEVQRRWQVGPDGVIPPRLRAGLRWGGLAALVVFPPFCLLFFWFYAQTCQGELWMLAPVTSVESLTPWSGSLAKWLGKLCVRYDADFWPHALRLPAEWLAYGGLGVLVAIAIEVFAVALPEELFHRGYLMSALEERLPPRRRILGAPLGLAAVLASLVFAVGHLVGMAEVARLATFFPSLAFSWLWRRSGSLWAPALFHAASNLLMSVLLASTFPS
jgi:membrane protease YdiL (CAAX protease family)